MKRHLSIAGVVGIALVLASPARAQMAVFDGANMAQNMKTTAQEIMAVQQLKNQLLQLQQTYTMLTHPMNTMQLATGLERASMENPMPTVDSMVPLLGGQTQSSVATSFYSQNHVYSPTDGSFESNQINSNGQSIANIQGMAVNNLTAIQGRLQELPSLESSLTTANSITSVEAINGRIAAENQFVQAQQAQAANLQLLAYEQKQSQEQQEKERYSEDMNQTLLDYQGVLNQEGSLP